MDGVSEEDLVYRGDKRTIAWARDAQGRRNALDYLEASAPLKSQHRLDHWFQVMGDMGRIANIEAFRKESNDIWGFKAHQVRVGAFLEGRIWYLTHAFTKKQQKWPKREIERAERIRTEHRERQGLNP